MTISVTLKTMFTLILKLFCSEIGNEEMYSHININRIYTQNVYNCNYKSKNHLDNIPSFLLKDYASAFADPLFGQPLQPYCQTTTNSNLVEASLHLHYFQKR